MSTALLALLTLAAPLELVTVPTSTEAEACEVLEAAAEIASRDPNVWVERRPGQIAFTAGREAGVLTLGDERARIRREHSLADTVKAVAAWRGLKVDLYSVAPSQAAWRAACQGRPAAYALAGSALTPAMLRAPLPPPERAEGPLMRFVAGVLDMKEGRARPSQLEDWLEALRDGATLPRWVAPELVPEAEGAGALGDGRALFHEDRRFWAVDLSDGERTLLLEDDARSEPEVRSTARGPLFLTGAGLRWGDVVLPLADVFPEIVIGRERLHLATPDAVMCVALSDGRTLWTQALEEQAVAGPVEVGDLVVVPLEDELLAFSAIDGEPRWRAGLGDDLSAPLIPGRDAVWALVGARTIIGVDARTGRWSTRSDEVPPLRDALGFGDRLMALAGRGGLWSLDLRSEATLLDPEASGPLRLRTGLGGFVHRRGAALVARSAIGAELWSSPIDEGARLVDTVEGLGLVLSKDSVEWLDLRQGRVVARIPTASPPRDGVATTAGAVVVDQAGRLMAIPRADDPNRRHLEQFAAALVGEAHRQSGARSAAQRAAELRLARAPRDLGARLLRARVERRPELETWLPVTALAPESSAARAEALAQLESLGVEALVPLPEPPTRMARVEEGHVQFGGQRWTGDRVASEGEMPPPELDRTRGAAPSPVEIGGWTSESSYEARLVHAGAALAVKEDAWWLLRPETRPLRLVRGAGAQVHALEGGFAIVDERRVFGVDAERGRLVGPLSLTSAPLQIETTGDLLVAQTQGKLLEAVQPLRVRRGSSWDFGQRIAAWTTTDRILVATADAQLVVLAP